MGQKRASGPRCVDKDEVALVEWFEYGYQALCVYLAKQVAFDAWCVTHHREELF